MSELGLIERINREVLHTLGLAICRTPETGASEAVLVAPDGKFEYSTNLKSTLLNKEQITSKLLEMSTGQRVRSGCNT